jgi:multicomponent Na+:H+ antiporter subunit D
MLSGVVVKAGIFPLVRCALMLEEIDPIVRIFGVGTALLGICCAIPEQDTKRTLAFSTVSQLGFILAAPTVAGFYALTHGLVKSALFLIAGVLPSRNFQQLQHQPIKNSISIALVIASFSISGFPLLSGFGAKVLTSKNYLPWQVIVMNLAALGTAICFAKFIFLPSQKIWEKGKLRSDLWAAMMILLGGLIAANGFYYQAYTLQNIIKPLTTIALGWVVYLFIVKKWVIKLPRGVEEFDHLIGMMAVMLIIIFWMVRV